MRPEHRVISAHSRRHFLRRAIGGGGLLLLNACAGSPPNVAPTSLPTTPGSQAQSTPSPEAAVSPTVAASPSPATSPSPSPVAVATIQAAPASTPVTFPGTTLSFLGSHGFVPTADDLLRGQIEAWARSVGARVSVEFVNASDIQPRLAMAIQGGNGPDVVQVRDNWVQAFVPALADVSDVVGDLQRTYGDLYPIFEAHLKGPDGCWYGMPLDNTGSAMYWRQSWFRDAGAANFPDRLDAYHDLGRRLKAKGQPFGQTLGHAFGDAPPWCYGLLWGYGGREVDEQGQVAINSPETLQAVRDTAQAFREAYDEGGVGWDDTANNRAFLSGAISSTQNGAAIWLVARQERVPFLDDIGLALMPAGPRGRGLLAGTSQLCLPKYGQNLDTAKALLRHLMRPELSAPRFLESQGNSAGVSLKHDQLLPWDRLPPPLRVFREVGQYARAVGFPGPANQKAGLAWSRYVVVDMFARAVQGDSPEAAVASAEGELRAIYETQWSVDRRGRE